MSNFTTGERASATIGDSHMEKTPFKVRINLDNVKLPSKNTEPFGNTVVRLKTPARIVDVTIGELVKAISEGRAFTPGVMHGTGKADWKQQQLFVIDIDNDVDSLPHLTPEGVYQTLEGAGLYVVFMYYSYSSTPQKLKFRAVLVCDRVVTDKQEHYSIYQAIYSLFPKTEITNNAGRRVTKAQIDLSCCNLDRYFYGTNKGIVDGCRGVKFFSKTAAIKIFADTVQEKPASDTTQSGRVSMSKTHEQWQAHNKAAGVGWDLGQAIREFNLLDYITSTTGGKPSRGGGKDVRIDPCPLCGKNARFQVDTQKNVFQCFGDSCGAAGNIISFLKYEHGYDEKQAREHFKYRICGIDRQAEKEEYAMQKQAERQQATNAPLPPPQPKEPLPKIKFFNEIEEIQKNWYWYPYIRRGAITTVTATQGTGKSLLICKLAAMASRGERHTLPFHNLWDNFQPTEPEATLYLNSEDDPDTDTKGRLRVCGADMSKVAFVEAKDMGINFYNPHIEEWIKQANPTAVAFDPTQQFFSGVDPSGVQLDMNNSASVRPIMTHLKELARKYNFALLLICHPNKNGHHSALHSTMGSNDFTAAPRSAFYIGRNPEDKEQRIIAVTKANSVPDNHQKSLAYRIDFHSGGIVWEGESPLQADDITSNRRSSKKPTETEEKLSNKDRAKNWLCEYLEENGGYAMRSMIFIAAKTDGFKEWAINDARNALAGLIKVTDKGRGKTTYWYTEGNLPPEQMEMNS
ncbi:MAG: AAA family ATPase [Defluviitaleaceae bacterium]|nr:AAA family ATPase [Defluviitaleaceae bacterium]